MLRGASRERSKDFLPMKTERSDELSLSKGLDDRYERARYTRSHV
jgi:hypothetical protein